MGLYDTQTNKDNFISSWLGVTMGILISRETGQQFRRVMTTIRGEASEGVRRLSIFCGSILAAWLLIEAYLSRGNLNLLRVFVATIVCYFAGWGLVRSIAMKGEVSEGVRLLSISSGLILALGFSSYIILTDNPDLTNINLLRFIIALILLYLAGWGFVRGINWVVMGFRKQN